MREIKFRGINTLTNKWEYGYYFVNSLGMHNIVRDDFHTMEVVKESVGQYIGVKDKNGKEIYEGDLVECIAIKKYERDSGVYPIEYFVHKQRFTPNWVCHLGWGGWDSIEVVGNVYENPELGTGDRITN